MIQGCVLIIDDSEDLRNVVCENLEADGYMMLAAANADEALTILKRQRADVILLDLTLPDCNGLELISRLREYSQAPIIVISGKKDLVDKVLGLEMGADDYLGKPFDLKELSARVKANVRRYRARSDSRDLQAPRKIKFGNWVLDSSKFQIYDKNGKSGNLTVMEFRLLEALALSPNCVLSREQLLEKARDDSIEVFDRAVDIQITRIRKKIGDDPRSPQIIQTVRRAGYMLVCSTEMA